MIMIIGQPGHIGDLTRFIAPAKRRDRVWIAMRHTRAKPRAAYVPAGGAR
jgi:hypothetical protein